jgi:hypothetical protein
MKFTFVSTVVHPSPTWRAVITAHVMAESRSVMAKPPCTVPMGL